MKNVRASHRYAKALLDLSIERNIIQSVYEDAQTFVSICKESREFILFLKSPVIKPSQKKSLIETIFKSKFNELTYAFFNIVISKGRESILPEIAYAFIEEYKQHKGIVTAEVTTAVPLDNNTKSSIISLLNKNKQEVEIIEKIDSSILGGFIIKVGDKQINQSVKSKLLQLKYEFSQNLYESKL